MEMVNPSITPLLCKWTYVTQGIFQKFWFIQNQIKLALKQVTYASLKCSPWSPPSPSHMSMFGITAHWINTKFQFRSVILSLTTLCGPHISVNLAVCVQETLTRFDLTSKLYCITADTTTNNMTMGKALHSTIPHFDLKENLIGCMAHIINLVENDRNASFDIKKNLSARNSLPSSLLDLVTNNPQGNISTILSQVCGFLKHAH